MAQQMKMLIQNPNFMMSYDPTNRTVASISNLIIAFPTRTLIGSGNRIKETPPQSLEYGKKEERFENIPCRVHY